MDTQAQTIRSSIVPRFIRLRDAPAYLGMDKNRFNRDVRPHLIVVPIGRQGTGVPPSSVEEPLESSGDDASLLQQLDPFIGNLLLQAVHMGSLQEFIGKRREAGVTNRTINHALAVVRRIVNLAATEWRDEKGRTWLEHAPKIKMLPVKDARPPYPLTREEQAMFFQELPDHLARMALFKTNTGTREQEVCGLKWSYEVKVPKPTRGQRMNNTAWKNARERAAGVSFEDSRICSDTKADG